jgi:hypothetical protein
MAVVITCPHCGKLHSLRPSETDRKNCPFCGAGVTDAKSVETRDAQKPAKGRDWNFVFEKFWIGIVRGGIVAALITFLFRLLPLVAIVILLPSERIQNDSNLWLQVIDVLLLELAFWGAAIVAGMVAGAMVLTSWALIHNAKPERDWTFVFEEFWIGIVRGGSVAALITLLFRLLPLAAIVNALSSERVQNDSNLWLQQIDALLLELTFWGAAIVAGMVAGAMVLTSWALIHNATPYHYPPIRRAALVGAFLGPLGVVVAFTIPLLMNSAPANVGLTLIWHWVACLIAAPVGAIFASAATEWYCRR